MRIRFLEIHAERDWSLASIGPAYLAGMLREHGHVAQLQQVKLTQSLDEIVNEVIAAEPDLIGLSLTTRQWLRAQEVVEALLHTAIAGVLNVPRAQVEVSTGGMERRPGGRGAAAGTSVTYEVTPRSDADGLAGVEGSKHRDKPRFREGGFGGRSPRFWRAAPKFCPFWGSFGLHGPPRASTGH